MKKDRLRIFWRKTERERERDLNGNIKNYHKRERERV